MHGFPLPLQLLGAQCADEGAPYRGLSLLVKRGAQCP